MSIRPNDARKYRTRVESLRVPGFTVWRGVHPRGTVLARHVHPDPTLCYVVRGRFTEYSDGRATDCRSSELKLTPANDPHWNKFVADETHGIRIDVDRARFLSAPAIHRMLGERINVSDARGRDLMTRLLMELRPRDEISSLVVEGVLLEVLAALARHNTPATGGQPRWLRDANDLIHERYSEPITLQAIAVEVGVAPATLARAYRRAYQATVGDKVRELRIHAAARDLVESDDPIAIVAVRSGFYDQSHFTALFRRRFGVTPAKYRAALT